LVYLYYECYEILKHLNSAKFLNIKIKKWVGIRVGGKGKGAGEVGSEERRKRRKNKNLLWESNPGLLFVNCGA